MSALQFEARCGEFSNDLITVGLGKSEIEKYLVYIGNIGSSHAEEVRKDRRPRPDHIGGTNTREPETWSGAHEIVVELERLRAGSRAFAEGRGAQQQFRFSSRDASWRTTSPCVIGGGCRIAKQHRHRRRLSCGCHRASGRGGFPL